MAPGSRSQGANTAKVGFPKFLELPQELQDQIWEAAVFDSSAPDSTPGIQFLDVCSLPRSTKWTGKYERHPAAIDRLSTFCFQADYRDAYYDYVRHVIPPLNNNDSAYRINSTLFSVSRGAREALRRYNRIYRRRMSPILVNTVRSCPRARVPNGEIWYEWDNSTDLICLRPIDAPGSPDISPSFQLYSTMWNLIEARPPWQLGRPYTGRFCSLALEFHPAWRAGDGLNGPLFGLNYWIQHKLLDPGEGDYHQELYIIDYRLKPQPGISVRDLGKPKFRGHKGLYYLADVTGGNFGIPAVADVVPRLRDSRHSDTDGEILGAAGMEYQDLYRSIYYATLGVASNGGFQVRILARVNPEH